MDEKGYVINKDIDVVNLTEDEVIEAINNKDYELILRQYIRILNKIVSRYRNMNCYNYEDFLQISFIGLMKSINNFDNTKGVKFVTFLTKVVHNEIKINLRSEIKNDIWVSLDDVTMESYKGDKEIKLVDTIIDETSEFIELLENKQVFDYIVDQINEIIEKPRDREIILTYLMANKSITQREIAERHNISRSYVSRIINSFMVRIKPLIKRDLGYTEETYYGKE